MLLSCEDLLLLSILRQCSFNVFSAFGLLHKNKLSESFTLGSREVMMGIFLLFFGNYQKMMNQNYLLLQIDAA